MTAEREGTTYSEWGTSAAVGIVKSPTFVLLIWPGVQDIEDWNRHGTAGGVFVPNS